MTTPSTTKCPTIEEIEEMWREDSPLDKTILAEQSLDTDYLHSKYLKIYRQCKEQTTRLNIVHNKAILTAKEYYLGKADAQTYKEKPFDRKIMKSDVGDWIKADDSVAKAKIALEKANLKVELCESILKQISYRSFSIKNAIQYIKFLSGDTSS